MAGVYALSLAVYCTSWTFFGTVTQAARYDWPLPPTFVGTIALYVLGAGVLVRLVRAGARDQLDFARRLHRHAAGQGRLAGGRGHVGRGARHRAVHRAAAEGGGDELRAAGTRPASRRCRCRRGRTARCTWRWRWRCSRCCSARGSASAAEHNRGLVLAMAFEALLKLGAMLALGAFVLGAAGGAATAARAVGADGTCPDSRRWCCSARWRCSRCRTSSTSAWSNAATSATCCSARWLFPLYLLLIALPVLPIARAGDAWLGAGTRAVRPVRAGAAAVAGQRGAGTARLSSAASAPAPAW